jgi:hypothetical protein
MDPGLSDEGEAGSEADVDRCLSEWLQIVRVGKPARAEDEACGFRVEDPGLAGVQI